MKEIFKSKKRWIAFFLALLLIVTTCIHSSDVFLWATGEDENAASEQSESEPAEDVVEIEVEDEEEAEPEEETNQEETAEETESPAAEVTDGEDQQDPAENAGQETDENAEQAPVEGEVPEEVTEENPEIPAEIVTYSYTVHYYYDGAEDEGARAEGNGALGDAILTSDVKKETVHNEKNYVLDHVENKDGKIGEDAGQNVVKVYYVLKEEVIEKPAQTLTASASDGARVTVVAPEGALPAGAKVTAKVVTITSEMREAVEDASGGKTVKILKAYDVTITDAEGNEIQPDDSVKVTIQNADVEGENLGVYHMSEEGTEKVAENADAKKASFEVEHFSIIAYTIEEASEGSADVYVYMQFTNIKSDAARNALTTQYGLARNDSKETTAWYTLGKISSLDIPAATDADRKEKSKQNDQDKNNQSKAINALSRMGRYNNNKFPYELVNTDDWWLHGAYGSDSYGDVKGTDIAWHLDGEMDLSDLSYTVKYLDQDGNEIGIEKKTGTLGEVITADNVVKKEISGYTFDEDATKEKAENLTIGLDESENVINVYYRSNNTSNVYVYVAFSGINDSNRAQVEKELSSYKLENNGKGHEDKDKNIWFTIGKISDAGISEPTDKTAPSTSKQQEAAVGLLGSEQMAFYKGNSFPLGLVKDGKWSLHGADGADGDGYKDEAGSKATWHLDGQVDLGKLSYTVNYLDQNGNPIPNINPEVKNGSFGETITADDEKTEIGGYTFDPEKSTENVTIGLDESKNVVNVYYKNSVSSDVYVYVALEGITDDIADRLVKDFHLGNGTEFEENGIKTKWYTIGKIENVGIAAPVKLGISTDEDQRGEAIEGLGRLIRYNDNTFPIDLITSWNLRGSNGATDYSDEVPSGPEDKPNLCWHLDGKVRCHEVTVTANSLTDTYDGTPKAVSGFAGETNKGIPVTAGGKTYYVTGLTSEASGTNVADSQNAIPVTGTAVVKDADGKDVTALFDVKVTSGALTINKRMVTLTSANLSKKYDGKALTNGDTALATETGWADGEGATYTFTGSQTLVGNSANAFSYKLNDNTDENNYTISKSEGTLTVSNRDASYEVTVTANSTTATYDGKEKQASGFIGEAEQGIPVTADGQTYYVTGLTSEASGTNVADSKTTIPVTGTAVVTDAAGNNVTDQFAVTVTPGSLTINKRNVTLTSADLSKMYDGTELTNGETALEIETGWADGEGAIYTFTGSQTVVGNSANAFSYTLNAGTDANNYNIEKEEGELTINPRELTITAGSAEGKYTGNPLTVSNSAIIVEGLLEGHSCTATVTGSQTLVGSSESQVVATTVAIVDDENGNGDVTKNYHWTTKPGTITVTDGTEEDPVEDDLVVKKTNTPPEGGYKAGDTVEFTIHVTNIFNEEKEVTVNELENVLFADKEAENTNASGSKNSRTYTIAAGETKAIKVTYVITEADVLAGGFKNTASVILNGKTYEGEDIAKTVPMYTLTIYYQYTDGTTAATTYTGRYLEGENYLVYSPAIEGYNSSAAFITGTMENRDRSFVIYYSAPATPATPTTPGGGGGGTTPTPPTPPTPTPPEPTIVPDIPVPAGAIPVVVSTEQALAALGDEAVPLGALIDVDEDGNVTITPINVEEIPLAGGVNDGHLCCILHFLLMLAALIIYSCYTDSMKKHQKKLAELKDELAKEMLKKQLGITDDRQAKM